MVESNVQSGNLTVSEAHGYGMIIAALMAGYDPNARAIFDGMYAYFREHPTATHDHLMSWYQKKSCADAEGNDSASDGDLDIAFALLLADKQWGSCGAVDYLSEALATIADVKDGDLDSSARYVLLGDWATPDDTLYYPSTRTSDFMPDHFRSFRAASGDTDWTGAADRVYQIVDALQTGYGPSTGLLPDFVVDPLGSPQPAPPDFLEGPDDGRYAYNACRDPWRLATDFLVSGDARAATAVQAINEWAKASTGGDPQQIQSTYRLDGTPNPDADYLSMAFVAPLGAGAMVDASNQAWLNAIWDLVVSRPIDAEGYYENTLKLLSMIVMSGNWWAPEAVSGGCVNDVTPLCTNGGYLSDADLALQGLGGAPGDQKLLFKGSLFFPQGLPVAAPLAGGAQILLEDLGNGGSAVFDLSADTSPIPSSSDPTCDAHDGWKIKPTRTLYRNRSTALDAPACTLGSANGLSKLQLRPSSDHDVDFKIKTRRSTIANTVGPLRVTLVLGKDASAGSAGACAVGMLSCTDLGSKLRCR